jgi:dephospho-CoA kinase
VIRLGLTGAIASGKSTVLAEFAARGIPTFSSDAAVHALYDSAAVPAIEQLFPGVTTLGRVDRNALSRRLVEAPEKLRALEAVVHPLVRQRMQAFLRDAEADGARLAVVDVPLLYETGFDHGFDKVAVTWAPDAVLHDRALARPGMSVEKLAAILARQMPQAEKLRRADYVIDTSGSLEATRATVARIIDELVSKEP